MTTRSFKDTILSIYKEGWDVARRFNELGLHAFVLKYRVPARPGRAFGAAPLQDAQRAIGIVRENAAKYSCECERANVRSSLPLLTYFLFGCYPSQLRTTGDPDKIGFAGFSAGGHLTAHISTAWRQRSYDRVDTADDASCRPDFSVLVYPWTVLDGNKPNAQNLTVAVDAETPPAFLAANADDTTAPFENSVRYFSAKVRAGSASSSLRDRSRLNVFPSGVSIDIASPRQTYLMH